MKYKAKKLQNYDILTANQLLLPRPFYYYYLLLELAYLGDYARKLSVLV